MTIYDFVAALFVISLLVNIVLLVGLVLARIEKDQMLQSFWRMRDSAVDAAKGESKLKEAIIKHMKAKGHDRCWLNDLELYSVVDPKYAPSNMKLPELPEFLGNCAKYWQDSQPKEVPCTSNKSHTV